MTDPILALRKQLKLKLGLPIVVDIPAQRPKKFVSLELTGLSEQVPGLIYSTYAIQAWADSHLEAAQLGHGLRKALAEIDEESVIFVKIRVSQMYYWPDPDSKTARYQLVVDATLYDQ